MNDAEKQILKMRIKRNSGSILIGRAYSSTDDEELDDLVNWLVELLTKNGVQVRLVVDNE